MAGARVILDGIAVRSTEGCFDKLLNGSADDSYMLFGRTCERFMDWHLPSLFPIGTGLYAMVRMIYMTRQHICKHSIIVLFQWKGSVLFSVATSVFQLSAFVYFMIFIARLQLRPVIPSITTFIARLQLRPITPSISSPSSARPVFPRSPSESGWQH